jgi:hypothetical protein
MALPSPTPQPSFPKRSDAQSPKPPLPRQESVARRLDAFEREVQSRLLLASNATAATAASVARGIGQHHLHLTLPAHHAHVPQLTPGGGAAAAAAAADASLGSYPYPVNPEFENGQPTPRPSSTEVCQSPPLFHPHPL